MMHTTIRMVQTADGTATYRRARTSSVDRRVKAGHIHLESAEGDEEANAVTYWYGFGPRELCRECNG